MTNLTELKQKAGIEDNPDQEGLDLFAKLIIEEAAEFNRTTCSCLVLDEMILAHFGLDKTKE
jgi:hypothetical protein